MARSALTMASPKTISSIHTPTFRSKPTSSLPPLVCFATLSRGKQSPLASPVLSNKGIPPAEVKKSILGVGFGFLAASVLALSPMDADATRIEYYATVEDPPCDLNFVQSGLGFCDVSVGTGEEAPYAELINVHYTARFADGTVFDSSYKRGRSLTMRIGVGKVTRGLDQGIFGGDGVPPMHVGGHRKLQIPPQLAYGPEPAGCFSGECNIPANATLLYDIHFVEVYSGNRKFTPLP